MERRDIEIFLTLAEHLHFGRTADELRTSVARVSQTIKKLERRIGAPLFERTSRQVAPTPIGSRLHEDLRPAYDEINEAVERAIAAGRGLKGVLRAGFVDPAAGRLLLETAELFRARHPDCEVHIRENQFGDGLDLLRKDEIDVLLATFPIEEADLSTGPALLREAGRLAVPSRHPFARRETVSIEDLARDKVLTSPSAIPDYWDRARIPPETPSGKRVERGPVFATIQEMLALVGAGQGMYPVPEVASRYYPRPDVAYIPFDDAEPYEWGLIWRTTAETSRIRAFNQAALETAG